MKPTPSDVHVDAVLSNLSVAFMQAASHFVADQVFPIVEVAKQSDRYYVYDRGFFNRDTMEERAPATESAGTVYSLDNTPTYYCREWAIHQDVPDQVIANADSVLNPFQDATSLLVNKALIRREKAFMDAYFKTGVWSTDLTGVASGETGAQFRQWNDENSDPIVDLRAASTTILESTGFRPNVLVLGKRTYDALIDNAAIIDRIKYGQTASQAATANLNLLAQLFEVDRVLVSQGIVNGAKEGASNDHSFIAGKGALLLHVAPRPSLMTPSAGYTFAWTGMGGMIQSVKRFRMDALKAERVELETAFDQHQVAADLGVYFATAVA